MFITLITDCNDGNALGRSTTRLSTLFSCYISTVGVSGWDSDLEASGNLIDMLDASNGEKGCIIVNVAPRHKSIKRWPNGTPFGYFYYKNTVVLSSIDGQTLSLIKKLQLTDTIRLFDIPQVLAYLKNQNQISEELEKHITDTQFRSFEFLPRAAKWLTDGIDLPYTELPIAEIENAPAAIWLVDNFGNCKTTLFPEDVDFEVGKTINLKIGSFTCYRRLKDVPDQEKALIIGSSGIGERRFLEVVIQGVNAAKTLQIKSGSVLLDDN